MRPVYVSLLLAGALGGLVLASPDVPAGDGYGHAAAPSAKEMPHAEKDVRIYDKYYSPSLLYVPSGTTVRWTNQGQHNHTVTSNKGSWDSGEIAPGAQYSITFQRPGTYGYYCTIHD